MTTRFLTLLFLGYAYFTSAQSPDPYPPTSTPDRIMLSWSDNPATTQSVTWRTDVSVKKAWAEITLAEAGPSFREETDSVIAQTELLVTNTNAAHFHSVTFTNLIPDTMYVYRVGDGKRWSEWLHFETAADEEAPFSFLYFGDAQNEVKSMWSRCIRQAYSTMPNVDFLLHAGDLINAANNDPEWGEWFYAGGWIYGMKPSIATPGNHEYQRNEWGDRTLSTHWRPTFTLPENGPEGLKETVYYTDYQNTRFISLNTQAMYESDQAVLEQQKWLEKVLRDNPNKWTIVTHHHPIYSTKFGRNNERIRIALQPLYEEFGVDLVLQGHDHTYGRGHNLGFGTSNKKDGPVYVVSVSGPKMYDLSFDDWLERVASNTQLYQLIRVDGDVLRYEAYTATGKLYDAFSLQKDKNRMSTFIDQAPADVPEAALLPERAQERMTADEIQEYQKRFQEYKIQKE